MEPTVSVEESSAEEIVADEEQQRASWLKDWNPIVVAIIGATLALLGNVLVGAIEARNAIVLEQEQLQSSLILEAVKSGDPEEAADRLLFLAEVGLLERNKEELLAYIERNNRVPSFSEPIATLDEDDPYREISSGVGLLETTAFSSTAVLISNDYILAARGIREFNSATLKMGFLSPELPYREFAVDPEPIESGQYLGSGGYAIYRVQGQPAAIYDPIPIRRHEAEPGEPLFVIHHGEGKPLAISLHPECRVVENSFTRESDIWLGHACDTAPGSAGAPIFSAEDSALLGLHMASNLTTSEKGAIRITALIEDSRILSELARR